MDHLEAEQLLEHVELPCHVVHAHNVHMDHFQEQALVECIQQVEHMTLFYKHPPEGANGQQAVEAVPQHTGQEVQAADPQHMRQEARGVDHPHTEQGVQGTDSQHTWEKVLLEAVN